MLKCVKARVDKINAYVDNLVKRVDFLGEPDSLQILIAYHHKRVYKFQEECKKFYRESLVTLEQDIKNELDEQLVQLYKNGGCASDCGRLMTIEEARKHTEVLEYEMWVAEQEIVNAYREAKFYFRNMLNRWWRYPENPNWKNFFPLIFLKQAELKIDFLNKQR